MLKSSSMSGEIYSQEHTDGSQSDTALGTVCGGSKKRRSSLSARVVAIVGNRRSRSTSQISGPGESPASKANGHIGNTSIRDKETDEPLNDEEELGENSIS